MVKAYSVTDIGKKRQINQDCVDISLTPVGNLPNLFLLADGMGGHKAGDYASRYAIDTVKKEVNVSPQTNPVHIFAEAIEYANTHLYEKSLSDVNFRGMGTTLVAATCIDNKLNVANIGDSRLYLVRQNKMVQVTRDHSYVAELVQQGGIDRETAKNHPKRNYITRAVGAFEKANADFFYVETKPGDVILICSDGLTNMLSDEEILSIIYQEEDLEFTCNKLVQAANEKGGIDNISVILVKTAEAGKESAGL
ncbi:MAG: Stp1/IreP family PP2C-type Ser/Thr phosphatase [Lachnospiraceae bacterium]|nr:Stp1/IreP family PP2C-type Ser/Thr phosphatase [Lachnospiraceae bacterium]